MIGNTACGDAFLTSETKIVCEVPALPAATYDVKVIVASAQGNLISECIWDGYCKLII